MKVCLLGLISYDIQSMILNQKPQGVQEPSAADAFHLSGAQATSPTSLMIKKAQSD